MDNGTAASFQDNSSHGEDAFLIRDLGDNLTLDAVLDGVTHCQGGYASGFTSDLLRDAAIDNPEHLTEVLRQANNTLFQSGRGRTLLTTVSAALKLGNELHIIHAGDSPGYLIRAGEAIELTTIVTTGLLPGVVSGAVGMHQEFRFEHKVMALEPNDRLLLITDGVINNLFPHELAAIVYEAASPEEAASDLEEMLAEKRRLHKGREDTYGTFREDDLTALFRFFG